MKTLILKTSVAIFMFLTIANGMASVTTIPVSISTTALTEISGLSDIKINASANSTSSSNYTNACVYTNAGGKNNGAFKITATTTNGSFNLIGTTKQANMVSYRVDYYNGRDLTGTPTSLPFGKPVIVKTTNTIEPKCSTIGDNASINVTVNGTPNSNEIYKSTLNLTLTAIP